MSPTQPSSARRTTRQKTLVHGVLSEQDAFVSAQSIHHTLTSRGEKVGLATIYRNLQALAGDGELDTLRTEDGETLYRMCGPRHHHHLVCRTCHKVVEIEGPAVETWASQAAAEHGFVDVSHTVELFGECADCRVSAGR